MPTKSPHRQPSPRLAPIPPLPHPTAYYEPRPARLTGVPVQDQSHYFTSPTEPAAVVWRRVRLAGHDFDVATAGGVFSATKLDLGTQVLLRTVANADHRLPVSGLLVDVGCGWGALSLVMATLAPKAQVWAVDSNPRALELTRLNAQRAGLDNLQVATVNQAAAFRPDVIWSNPPIRVGKAALHQLLTDWLSRLTPTGHATLVVQRHLGADSLAQWLTDQGYPTERLASAKGYRVLTCRSRGSQFEDQPPPGEPGRSRPSQEDQSPPS